MPDNSQPTYRILDANANRASEGLRTLEEFARFILNDADATSQLKTLRHRLTTALGGLCRQELIAARDTRSDVGTVIQTASEITRATHADVVASAASRTQQSLRCLEEYGKLVDTAFAVQVESIRYAAYTITAIVESAARATMARIATDERRERLHAAQIYALIDASADRDAAAWQSRIRRLAEAGVDIIQLRDKSLDDRRLAEAATAMATQCRKCGVLFIVNDRADIALASDADGVHVGQDELPVDQVRKLVSADRLIGLSTHNVDQIREGVRLNVDYIGCGPTFAGRTKSFADYPGPAFLRQAAQWILRETDPNGQAIPAFAIGGIDVDNVAEVAAAGFHRIAVTAALANLDDVSRNAEVLRAALAKQPLTATGPA